MKKPAPRKTSENTTDGGRSKTPPAADAGGRKMAPRAANQIDRLSGGSPAASREEEIRGRAYSLWENEGRPEGKHGHHWTLAEHELDAQQGEADDPPNLAALREASREHTDAFLVKTDLEDADQREASPGTREQD
ncbi:MULTISPECIES: DUF2934 domain-containing protein [Rhizobium]|nr:MULTISPECIES: DUF2934 domain-containing protein [Rhizobium]NEI95711.1 DUF2934 domain-containing protein [Rhizobium leguminosarum]NEJ79379.1 DUF2934 domain-containing protein [Rhizobium leguminosarum]NKL23978.1 DUF2934 domain-containing protein [Rhizobium leguminosarum bv. viciae]NKL57592.1 DUF2934 domain-containing protein [Rhizobium leguminosarum bv. viciae]QIO69982.1 DUF2934 domain-containing protein [Rhizobium leguminosarum bv. trifolii]